MSDTFSSAIENPVLDKIRKHCEVRGISIYKLAKLSDIPYSSLNNIFVRNTQPTVPTLTKICSGLGMTLSQFFDDELFGQDSTCHYDWLSPDEQFLVECYRSISKSDKKLLSAYAQGLAHK